MKTTQPMYPPADPHTAAWTLSDAERTAGRQWVTRILHEHFRRPHSASQGKLGTQTDDGWDNEPF